MIDMHAVEAAFFIALGLTDPARRAAYLDRLGRDDPDLQAALARLLAAHADLGDFLEPAAPTSDGPNADPSLGGTVRMDVPGTVLTGRYKLLEVIGEGGMGTVWMAQQAEPVRRVVAVKLVKAGMDSRQVLARFEAERQALALMDHPNIARVLDGGAAPDGRPFFVMELVKGVPITRFCDDRRLDPRERLELFVPVCLAIQHAHQKGVIHRDIKPNNVLVALYDDHAVPKVIDFGIAKAAGQTLTERTLMTGFGAVVGTPEYMSPEQATLNNLDVDTRSDVYSLGVLLYELLAGSPPISREELGRSGLLEILRVVREEEPPRPSQKLSGSATLPCLAASRRTEPRRLTALIRGELDWIVMKALEKDRARRYESAGGLAADVRRHLGGEPVLAVPPSVGYRLRKFLRRHRGPVVAGGLVFLALVSGVVGTTWGLLRAEAERANAVRAAGDERRARQSEAVAAKSAAARADELAAVLRFVQDRVLAAARPRGQEGGLGKDATIQAAVDAAEPGIVAAFPGRPGIEAAVRDAIGWTYWYLAEYPRAAAQFERARSLRRAALGEDHPETLASGYALASAWFHLPGRLPDVIALEEEVLRRREATLGPNHPDTELSRGNLAISYDHSGRNPEAVVMAELAYRRLETALGPDDRRTLEAGVKLAGPLSGSQPSPETARFLEGLIRRMEPVLGADGYQTQAARQQLAVVLAHVGREDEAIAIWERVIDGWARSGSADHLQVLEPMNRLAILYRKVGRRPESLAVHEKLLAIARHRHGPSDPDHTLVYIGEWLATLLADGQYDRVAEEGRKLLAVERTVFPADHLRVAATLTKIGRAELGAGRADRAEAALRECLAIREKAAPDSWATSSVRSQLGRAVAARGEYSAAEPLLVAGYEGLKRREKSIPADAKDRLTDAADRLVDLYTAWGRPAEAARWRAERSKYPPPGP